MYASSCTCPCADEEKSRPKRCPDASRVVTARQLPGERLQTYHKYLVRYRLSCNDSSRCHDSIPQHPFAKSSGLRGHMKSESHMTETICEMIAIHRIRATCQARVHNQKCVGIPIHHGKKTGITR